MALHVDRPVRLERLDLGELRGVPALRPVPGGPPGSLLIDGSFPPEGEKRPHPRLMPCCARSTPAALGPLRKVRLWHDSSGACPAWYVSHVMVKELRQGRGRWFFPAECWLAAGRQDGRVERELACLRRGLGFRKVGAIVSPGGPRPRQTQCGRCGELAFPCAFSCAGRGQV